MDAQENMLFQEQIKEDIDVLTSRWSYADPNLCKPEYAFNYWILSRIYSIDEEIIPDHITEYNDKGIDCYVYYEESKELFIIQNKYYNSSLPVARPDISDFLQTPLALLKNNQYKKSQSLQNIFNRIKDDPEYKISFHFFASTDNRSKDIDKLVCDFNCSTHGLSSLISASFIGLTQIYELVPA